MVASRIVSSFDRFLLPVPIVTVDDRSTIIWLAGEQDLAVVDALRAALDEVNASPTADVRPQIVIDLRGVTFIDTPTARALIDSTLAQPGSTWSVTLREPSACVRRMLRICGRAELLDTA